MMAKATESKARPPLTDEELGRLTADDFLRLKLSEDEKFRLREINKGKEHDRAERAARLHNEEQPIVTELRSVGLNIDSVWNLVNASGGHESAIPVLLKHLMLPYSDRTREGIARALAVADAQYAWSTLVAEYLKAPTGRGVVAPGDTKEFRLGAKDGLAVALSATVTDATIDELITLAKDPSLGESRVLLLRGIRKSRNPAAKRAIKELASDPALAKEIASWRKGRRAR